MNETTDRECRQVTYSVDGDAVNEEMLMGVQEPDCYTRQREAGTEIKDAADLFYTNECEESKVKYRLLQFVDDHPSVARHAL